MGESSLKHATVRVRHDIRRRMLTVKRRDLITPSMLRLILNGAELQGFTSLSPDDHIKVILPSGSGKPTMRDYTPRRYDATANELTVDFALHDAGPVTDWARGAQPGSTIEVGGPRGSLIISDDLDWWLLIGDETALPAIGRRLEEMRAGVAVTTIVSVRGPEDEQAIKTNAHHRPIWIHRGERSPADAVPLLQALSEFVPPPGDGFIWIAAEAGVAKALRNAATSELGRPNVSLKANGYWVLGKADASEKFDVETSGPD